MIPLPFCDLSCSGKIAESTQPKSPLFDRAKNGSLQHWDRKDSLETLDGEAILEMPDSTEGGK
jgi:hypothetical protein